MALNYSRSFICRQCRETLLARLRPQPRLPRATPQARRHASVNSSPVRERPFRVGIIGSGPAGFYAAARLIQKSADVAIDMYEKLPAPFGLVRYGVAPDHPEVKNCQDKFNEVALSPRFNFIGNVSVGRDVPLARLKPHYDALLFAYGASEDRELGIPGENSHGILSARAFVGWYNGLPQFADLRPDLECDDTTYVIGNGNVALDVARILLSPLETLRKTDIAESAIETISKSRIRQVSVCGRRGPMQAAFTIKEVRELLTLPEVAFHSIDSALLPSTEYISSLPRLEQRKYRLANLLREGSRTPQKNSKASWELASLQSPREFEVSQGDLKGIVFGVNAYDDLEERFNPKAQIYDTGETFISPARLAFRSIGYRSEPLNGLETDLGVPFDKRKGIIPNDMQGRVLSMDKGPSSLTAAHVPGCYCTGWVKRGPTGVIASTMEDAFSSADILLKDWAGEVKFFNGSTNTHRRGTGHGWNGVLEETVIKERSAPRWVSWEDWLAIDRAEEARGKALEKPREKFQSVEQMLNVLR